MKLIDRIKYLPGSTKRGISMGVSKKALVCKSLRFLFTGSFRKTHPLFKRTILR